jgi:tetratricopeptide (TPR) repeat protein
MRIRTLVAAILVALMADSAGAQFASERDRREAFQHYRDGQEHMSSEQFEKAAEAFQKAIQQDRLLTLAHYGLGQATMGLRQYASAIQAFTDCRDTYRTLHDLQQRDRLMVERQRDDEIRELRESVRRIRSGQVRLSQVTADKIERRMEELERQRSSVGSAFQPPAEVSLSLGSAYFRSGALEDAEREYRAALAADPKMGEAHNNLAVVMFLTERLDDAKVEVELAKKAGFKVNPNFEQDLKRAAEAAKGTK